MCRHVSILVCGCSPCTETSGFLQVPHSVNGLFQAGWKENHATFMCELKNLQASGLTTLGHALRTAFDLLNLNRLVSGIDNYGQVSEVTVFAGGQLNYPSDFERF